MTEDADPRAWRIETDPTNIRELAAVHDAVPTRVEPVDDGPSVDIEVSPGEPNGARITWAEFFERFEDEQLLVRYRPSGSETDSTLDVEVVERSTTDWDDDGSRAGHPDDHGTATSDTGDEEPPFQEGSERDGYGSTDYGSDENTPHGASTAPQGDTARGPTAAADGLVLDEVHPGPVVVGGGLDREHVTFVNEGDRRIDLSGWRVRNSEGRAYEFGSETVLDPGERITLHTGDGTDTESDRYWDAGETVWASRDEVVVETASGERVLREPYEV